jgi:hypothetical protein
VGAAVATGRRVIRRRARTEVVKCMIIPYKYAAASSKTGKLMRSIDSNPPASGLLFTPAMKRL